MGNTESAPKRTGVPPASTTPGKVGRSTTASFRAIRDRFNTIEDVQAALREQGLESSQLVLGIDFTKSNEWTGKHTFKGRCLHDTGGPGLNPYEEAFSIIARTLAPFDDDDEIPIYGFGDARTNNTQVFSFYPGDRLAHGLPEVLRRYKEVAPKVKLAGPTSFAPMIYQALRLVAQTGQYHILVILADGQVTRGADTPSNAWSPDEKATVDAIVTASNYGLSIIMVGVGDGPWDVMKAFDDSLPSRTFDNFQFVDFNGVMVESRAQPQPKRDAQFALRALMEIPDQYRLIQKLGLIGKRPPPGLLQSIPAPLGPPKEVLAADAQRPQLGNTQPPSAPAFGAAPSAPAFKAGAMSSSRQSGGPSAEPPSMFVCPITQEVMHDPVMAADGYTYERAAIEGWLSSHNTSPLSNAPLPHTQLTPNFTLRSAIKEWQGA